MEQMDTTQRHTRCKVYQDYSSANVRANYLGVNPYASRTNHYMFFANLQSRYNAPAVEHGSARSFLNQVWRKLTRRSNTAIAMVTLLEPPIS